MHNSVRTVRAVRSKFALTCKSIPLDHPENPHGELIVKPRKRIVNH